MRGAALAAILLCAAACAGETGDTDVSSVASGNAVAGAGQPADAAADEEDADEEADGDHKQASFLIVIEHPDGWRCSGSLVSLRTALTSAWCARGGGRAAADELWALAAGAAAAPGAPAARQDGARRIVRVAVAADADAEVSDVSQREEASWRGGAMDLAVVELEEPFGSAALTVPILMATRAEECAAPAECHVARAVTRPPSRRARLRIASAALRHPDACAAAAPHWTAVQERALCLVGSELCESDWGAGVVCGGKVCGVLSRSVRAAAEVGAPAPAPGAGGGDGRSCGTTHLAQSTARWRRFLHCAHTLRACGSDGDCEELCVERRLIEETSPPPPPWTERAGTPAPARVAPSRAPPPPPPASHTPRPLVVTTHPHPTRTPTKAPWSESVTRSVTQAPWSESVTRSVTQAPAAAPHSRARPRFRPPPRPPPPTPPPPPQPAADDATPAPARLAFEFEPNRADFKAQPSKASPSVSVLKAGEYGDNAADYGGGDELVPPTRTPEPLPSSLPADPPPSSSLPPGPTKPPGSKPQSPRTDAKLAPSRSIPPAERRSAGGPGAPAPFLPLRSAEPAGAPAGAHAGAPACAPALALLVLTLFVNAVSCTR